MAVKKTVMKKPKKKPAKTSFQKSMMNALTGGDAGGIKKASDEVQRRMTSAGKKPAKVKSKTVKKKAPSRKKRKK